MKKIYLFLTLMSFFKIQTSEIFEVPYVVQKKQASYTNVTPYQRYMLGDNVYGSTSSIAPSDATEINSTADDDDCCKVDIYTLLRCCPCLTFQMRCPKLYSYCCDNPCSKCLFACCMK
ncbi:MAG TPA: hypothetical protein VLG50_01950 [Candidatus Saccharimonadales bacterium]|nr:hypothetical protein [Candidatus Saccharimonadales bacterium]